MGVHVIGEYSSKSAYCLLQPRTVVDEKLAGLYRCIWRLLFTEHVRYFVWLGVRGGLLTNTEHVRRHPSTDSSCSCCNNGNETLSHIFRDFGRAKESLYGDYRSGDAKGFLGRRHENLLNTRPGKGSSFWAGEGGDIGQLESASMWVDIYQHGWSEGPLFGFGRGRWGVEGFEGYLAQWLY
ncbi:hypothetical protein V2J09_001191 [Rumex salicifolius]